MISRRGLLGAMLAAAVAPAVVRASSLMPIAAPKIILPPTLFTGEIGVLEGFRVITTPTFWDLSLVTEAETMCKLKAIGVDPKWMSMPADPFR